MTKITSALVAAFIASASFATAALAEGNYYEGANRPSAGVQAPVTQARDGVSYGYTGSIAKAGHYNNQSDTVIGRGDYYEGANRPN